jgi:pimeloyl-ACP methyl ester carboxylesterase
MMAETKPYRSSCVLANGVKTHYQEAGERGDPVVLLHGGGPGASGEAGWRFMLPALAPHFRVYAPDQLSFGYTDTARLPTRAHQSLVDHIRDFIEALCLERVNLVGNSQGAYVAVKYALDHPNRVRKLFLIGSATIARFMGLTPPMTEGMKKLLAYDGTPQALRAFLEEIVLDKSTITDALIESRQKVVHLPGAVEARNAFEAANRGIASDRVLRDELDLRNKLPKLKIPTLFIWGVQDRFAPVELGYELQKLLPNITFEFLKGAGHQCQTDAPELVNQMVINFFKE